MDDAVKDDDSLQATYMHGYYDGYDDGYRKARKEMEQEELDYSLAVDERG